MTLTKSPKGYLAAIIGGVIGALLMTAIILLVSRTFFTLFPRANSGLVTLIPLSMLGIGLGEAIGCFTILRFRRFAHARTTALWLVALIIPGILFFFFMRGLIGGLLAVGLTVILLPLIARALTQHPNYPNTIQQVVHTYAKRPPNF